MEAILNTNEITINRCFEDLGSDPLDDIIIVIPIIVLFKQIGYEREALIMNLKTKELLETY